MAFPKPQMSFTDTATASLKLNLTFLQPDTSPRNLPAPSGSTTASPPNPTFSTLKQKMTFPSAHVTQIYLTVSPARTAGCSGNMTAASGNLPVRPRFSTGSFLNPNLTLMQLLQVG